MVVMHNFPQTPPGLLAKTENYFPAHLLVRFLLFNFQSIPILKSQQKHQVGEILIKWLSFDMTVK